MVVMPPIKAGSTVALGTFIVLARDPEQLLSLIHLRTNLSAIQGVLTNLYFCIGIADAAIPCNQSRIAVIAITAPFAKAC
jgi:hypothetical protein